MMPGMTTVRLLMGIMIPRIMPVRLMLLGLILLLIPSSSSLPSYTQGGSQYATDSNSSGFKKKHIFVTYEHFI